MSRMLQFGAKNALLPQRFYCHYYKELESSYIEEGYSLKKTFGDHYKMYFKGKDQTLTNYRRSKVPKFYQKEFKYFVLESSKRTTSFELQKELQFKRGCAF